MCQTCLRVSNEPMRSFLPLFLSVLWGVRICLTTGFNKRRGRALTQNVSGSRKRAVYDTLWVDPAPPFSHTHAAIDNVLRSIGMHLCVWNVAGDHITFWPPHIYLVLIGLNLTPILLWARCHTSVDCITAVQINLWSYNHLPFRLTHHDTCLL